MPVKATIGIDLGASKCCVASVHNGKLTVLPNARGENTTPSFVAFNDLRCLVGRDAKDQATVNPKNTVYGIKSILGRKFMDPLVRKYSGFSSALVTNDRGQPTINVEYRDRDLRMSPLLIAAIQLFKMKQEAEAQIGAVGGAVVSVPAYFGNSQREAIVAACQIAGLELLDLISEPTATALTYRENRGGACEPQTILVLDMGAAKLDVSVIRVSKEEVRVLAVCGDDSFGGDNLNEMLMVYIDDRFEEETQMSLLDDARARMRLKLACEEIKKKLTLLQSHKMIQDGMLNQKDLTACVTRKKFEKLFAKKFSADLEIMIDSLLHSTSLTKVDIDEVVVVGGSSRVPFIQIFLSRYFDDKELNRTVNADESVASGAAILANELMRKEEERNFVLREMVRVPVEDCSRGMSDFHRYVPLQPGMLFSVAVETPLTNGSTDREETCVRFQKFGIVRVEEVTVKKSTNESKKGEKFVTEVPQSEIESSRSQLGSFERDRIELENNEKAQNDLEGYCYSLSAEIESFKVCCSDADNVDNVCEKVLAWIENNGTATMQECEEAKGTLTEIWKKLNEDIKRKADRNLASIEANKRNDEKNSDNVSYGNESSEIDLRNESTLQTKKTGGNEVEARDERAVGCTKDAKEPDLVVEAREREPEVEGQTEQLAAEKKRLKEQLADENKKLTELLAAEKKKLTELLEAEKEKLTALLAAENKKLTELLAAEKKKLTILLAAEKKKLAEQLVLEKWKLAGETKKLAEVKNKLTQQLASEKKELTTRKRNLAAKEKNSTEQLTSMKKVTEQLAAEKKLAEQLAAEKKKLTEQLVAEKKLAEQLAAEKKKLSEQLVAEKKKQGAEKKKLAEQSTAKKNPRIRTKRLIEPLATEKNKEHLF